MGRIGIAVHGGAFARPEHPLERYGEGCRVALEAGLEALRAGATCLEAVELSVRVMENDETYDAGVGSYLDERGVVSLDAAMMDGNTLDTGAVAAVTGVRNPVTLARRVLESTHAVIVGDGARLFAERAGVPTCHPDDLATRRERARWEAMQRDGPPADWVEAMFGDTVGAIALDVYGNVAAATSTGGSIGKPVGRVGDTPMIGAGLYADNATGAAAVTGHGERIIPLLWASRSVELLRAMPAQEAGPAALQLLDRLQAKAGIVLMGTDGRAAAACNAPYMSYAVWDPDADSISTGPEPEDSP